MYLGIDLGTSSIKVLLIDRQQNVIASASSPLSVSRPHPGWSEQEPTEWVRATEAAIKQIQHAQPDALSTLRGIGLSGQMHGATLLDAQNRPLRPCILWNDTRSHEEAESLNADSRFSEITGNCVFPGFTAPKVVWVRRHEPAVFAAIAKVLLPKDFLRHWLTGDHCSDMSDASGTSWLDVRQRRWSPELLEATALGLWQMPRLVEGTASSGTLRAELAQQWGIPEGEAVHVAGGAGDNAASACGVGTVRPGTAFLSIGTSGVLFTATAEYRPRPESGVHTFCHAFPGIWHQMGVSLSASDCLSWLAKVTNVDPSELVFELGDKLRPPSGLIFLPYLSGERTPHNDAKIRASFVGLSHQTGRAELTQAVLEGVAFAFRDSLEAMRQSGTEFTQPIVAVGGGSKSIYSLKAIATALGLAIEVADESAVELGAAFGAARLGLLAAETDQDPLAVCFPPAVGKRIEPEAELRDYFESAYRRFRALYPAIRTATCTP